MIDDFKNKKHLFFDMDKTIAPPRQKMHRSMFDLLISLPHDVIIVSGQEISKIAWQSNNLTTIQLGQNGNHAIDTDGIELWNVPLEVHHQEEILAHIQKLMNLVDHEINHDWTPIENRGSQITFSPIGNTAPVDIKMSYDPERKKRDALLEKVPFVSEDLIVKIGGSTSLDYIHKDRHKGTNVAKLINLKGWNKENCIYFGDGLYPGGNDEAVIGVIDTYAVNDDEHTYKVLKKHFKHT